MPNLTHSRLLSVLFHAKGGIAACSMATFVKIAVVPNALVLDLVLSRNQLYVARSTPYIAWKSQRTISALLVAAFSAEQYFDVSLYKLCSVPYASNVVQDQLHFILGIFKNVLSGILRRPANLLSTICLQRTPT